MPICPDCRDEYVDGVDQCPTCAVALVPDGTPLPPRVDRLLGTFHPLVADRIVGLLGHRRIAHEALPADTDRIEVVVDRAFRDDLRAELAVNWTELLASLPPEQMYEVIGVGGIQPGWFDAPRSAWVDRDGRMQVEGMPDEEAEADARRILGPSLVTLGAVLGLFGWYADGSELWPVLGLGAVLLGLFLPR